MKRPWMLDSMYAGLATGCGSDQIERGWRKDAGDASGPGIQGTQVEPTTTAAIANMALRRSKESGYLYCGVALRSQDDGGSIAA